MNREERRKNGVSKETADRLENLKKPCTVLEAVQLAQGVSDDAIRNYHESINPIIVSLSLQIEVLKELLFEEHMVSEHASTSILLENEFVSRFNQRVDDYNKQKEEAIKVIEENASKSKKVSNFPKTDVVPSNIDIEVTK